jgi:hypothetical protein
MLRQPIAGIELDLFAAFVGQEPNAVELAFEQPLGTGEPIVGQRCRHGFEPVGHHVRTRSLGSSFGGRGPRGRTPCRSGS